MATPALVAKDFKPEVAPDWCPGCGDFGVLTGLFQAESSPFLVGTLRGF